MSEQEAAKVLAKAIAVLVDANKGSPQALLDRLNDATDRMDKAIAKVDTIEELLEALGDEVLDLVVETGTKYIKKVGPLGLAEAALDGVASVANYLGKNS